MSAVNFSTGICEWSLSETVVTAPLTLALIGLSLLSVFIILGNLLVILSVILCKNLRRKPTNFFILSLAVADFAVGISVLPFSTVNTGLKRWIFGQSWCQIWLMVDVLMCTASIYNLVAISVDRLIAILSPLSYTALMTHRRVRLMIFGIWLLSGLISIPPLIPWNSYNTNTAIAPDPCSCTPLNNSPSYVVFSSLGSFYIPFVVVIAVYCKIFVIARTISRSNKSGYVFSPKSQHRKLITMTSLSLQSDDTEESYNESTLSRHQILHAVGTSILAAHIQLPKLGSPKFGEKPAINSSLLKPSKETTEPEGLRIHKGSYATPKAQFKPIETQSATKTQFSMGSVDNIIGKRNQVAKPIQSVRFIGLDKNDRLKKRPVWFKNQLFSQFKHKDSKRILTMDIRAAKTVAIVTGCFICCWLGFAIVYLLSAFDWCENNSCVPELISSFVFWLGYVNSGLNVIIYAMFSNQFRDAFKSVLSLKPNKRRSYNAVNSAAR